MYKVFSFLNFKVWFDLNNVHKILIVVIGIYFVDLILHYNILVTVMIHILKASAEIKITVKFFHMIIYIIIVIYTYK